MELPARLPEPSVDERAASERMRERLRQAIRATDGFLPFEQYMDLALFAPGLGYYVGGARKFGATCQQIEHGASAPPDDIRAMVQTLLVDLGEAQRAVKALLEVSSS